MGWFGFGGRTPAGQGSPPSSEPSADGTNKPGSAQTSATSTDAVVAMTDRGGPETAHGVVVDLSYRAQTTASELAPSDPPLLPTAAQERQEEEGGEEASAGVGAGYVARLKAAVLDGVNTAKRAPETFEEALAVIKGERAVKPDYGRAVSTVTAAFAGGCVHGWWHGAALAAKYPPHQRSVVKFRAGAGRGVRFAAFALIFEGSSAAMEALRRKKDFVGGTVGGALAGMAYGVPGGVASARRGLFYGVWLGGLFSMFRNHVASLKEQAQLAEEHERLAQEKRDAVGQSALQRSIAGLDAQLKTWPTADDASEDETDPTHSLRRK